MRTVSKSIFAILTVISFVFLTSCEDNQADLDTTQTKVELLESGEWLLKGFEDSVMYTFDNGERATYYGENGVFPSESIPGKHAYSFQDEKMTLDLNFGNIFTYDLQFSCDNNIVEFYDDNGELNSILYRKNSNYQNCL